MDQVYTDPDQPGAPRPGDLVVVVIDGAPGTRWSAPGSPWVIGRRGHVLVYDHPVPTLTAEGHRWGVLTRSGWDKVHAVRRPTPEELATYQLSRSEP